MNSSSSTLTLASDCDGVLYQFNEIMIDWLVEQRGWDRNSLPVPHTYSLHECWPSLRDNEHLVEEMLEAFDAKLLFHTGEPYADALRALQTIRKAGHRIVIITARNLPGLEAKAKEATFQWLTQAGFPFDDLILTHRKEEVEFDLLVDDSPANVRAVLAAGKNAVLLNRPWTVNEPDLPLTTWERVPELLEKQAKDTKKS